MPRQGKKKEGRRGEAGRVAKQAVNDEEFDADNLSTASTDGSAFATMVDGKLCGKHHKLQIAGKKKIKKNAEDGEVDMLSAAEMFEEKFKEVVDNLTLKSAKARVDSLKSLRSALSNHYIPDLIMDRKMTICDALEKCLKKGRGEEQAKAAICIALVILQIGTETESEEIYAQIRPVLSVIMADNSMAPHARAACAVSLGIGSFIAGEDLEKVTDVMKKLETIFKDSYLKGDGSVRTHTPEIAKLHTDALNAWCLLLSIAPPSLAQNLVSSHLGKMPELLENSDVDIRIAAGEAIALMYELAREEDEDFEGEDEEELCAKFKELATDSNKFRAKKDRRTQRSSFRDIRRAVEDAQCPKETIRFATIEAVDIDSWVRKRQYDSLCGCLRSGMAKQLQQNIMVREIFGLDSPLLSDARVVGKPSKGQRHTVNAAAFKARTKAMAKARSKRTASITSHE